MGIIQLAASIPPAIWGVLLGSLLTFLGITCQLRHDARQRDRERQMHMRHEVYMQAAEGIAGSTEYFFRMANAEVPLSTIASMANNAAWITKVHTVASLETLSAFSEANAAFGVMTFDLLKLRFAVEEVTAEINALNSQNESCRALQQQLQAELNSIALQPATAATAVRARLVKELWDKTWPDLASNSQKLDSFISERWRRQRFLLEQAVLSYLDYQPKVHKAMVALRKELDLPVDEKEFIAALTKSQADVLPKFKLLLASFDQADPAGPAAASSTQKNSA